MADGYLTRGYHLGGSDASWSGNDVYSGNIGRKIGYVLGEDVYTANGSLIGCVRGSTIYSGRSKPVGELRVGDIVPHNGGATIAAYDGNDIMAAAAALLLNLF